MRLVLRIIRKATLINAFILTKLNTKDYIYSFCKLPQKGAPLIIKIDGSSSYAEAHHRQLRSMGHPAMLEKRILECRNEIFPMCIGHGYDC